MYWHEKLEEFEQQDVWDGFEHSIGRLAGCQSRVEALAHSATGVKDNLIFLSNMSSTQAMLTTTADTSNMKIIAILTALFLPFTFMAVRIYHLPKSTAMPTFILTFVFTLIDVILP
jgi:hypothetical protein